MSSLVAATHMPVTSTGFSSHLLHWLGKFHILVIHFPIALLAMAPLIELAVFMRILTFPPSAMRLLVQAATAMTIVAVILGWVHADIGGSGRGDLLSLHRWLGTAAGLWALVILVLSERDSRRGERSSLFRLALWTGAILVSAAAHFGGLLVHGRRFFDW
jgi:uncharacterized membrane protein